jgi:hypothetical protein
MDLTKPVRFRGVPFEFGDDVLIVPAVTCDQADELAKEIDYATSPVGLKNPTEMMALDDVAFRKHTAEMRERRAAMRKVICAAMSRNYPDMGVDMSDFITQENVQDLFNAAMAYTPGVEKIKDPGEWQASREKPGPKSSTGLAPAVESQQG